MSGLFNRLRSAARRPATWLGRKAATTIATAAIRDGYRRVTRIANRKRGLPPSYGYRRPKRAKGRNRGSRHSFPSKKAKGRGKGCKPLSSCMKKQIVNLMKQKAPIGTYNKKWVAVMADVSIGSQTWVQNSTYGDAVKTQLGSDFLYFNQARLLDVASILFNGKTAAMDYTVLTNNFQSVGFQYQLVSATVKTTFRNHGLLPVEFTVVECIPKEYTNRFAYQDFDDALTTIKQTGGSTKNKALMGIQPGNLPQMKNLWKMKTVKKVLYPGDYYTYSKTHKNLSLDWDKFYEGTAIQSYIPNVTCQLLISMAPVVSVSTDGEASPAAIAGRAVLQSPNYAITVETEEHYVVSAPEKTDDANREDNYCWFYSDDAGAMNTGSLLHFNRSGSQTEQYNCAN